MDDFPVGPAEDGNADRVGLIDDLLARRQEADHLVEEIPGARAVQGGDGDRLAESEREELRDHLLARGRVDLVHDEEGRPPRGGRAPRVAVQRGPPPARR